MRINLTVKAGPHEGQVFEFQERAFFVVGRSDRANFRLPVKDNSISRIHFMIEMNPPQCRLTYMGQHQRDQGQWQEGCHGRSQGRRPDHGGQNHPPRLRNQHERLRCFVHRDHGDFRGSGIGRTPPGQSPLCAVRRPGCTIAFHGELSRAVTAAGKHPIQLPSVWRESCRNRAQGESFRGTEPVRRDDLGLPGLPGTHWQPSPAHPGLPGCP